MVSSVYATTEYDLNDWSIQSVELTAPPTPYNYSAADLFTVLEVAFNSRASENVTSTAGILSYISSLIAYDSAMFQPWYQELEDSGIGERGLGDLVFLQNIMALPLCCVNTYHIHAHDKYVPPIDGSNVTSYFAKDIYRVVISKYSLYTFSTLAVIALLWSGIALLFCWNFGGVSPNVSQYPEVDFASKCSACPSESQESGTGVLLKKLRNANSEFIEDQIKENVIFIKEIEFDDIKIDIKKYS